MPTNRPTTVSHDTHAPPIDLAREAPFALGQLVVVPAELTLRTTGWSQRLEPRVMQVLVVLAQAVPAVVGRTELNMRVWRGRVVGDDAINRAMQTLRRIAADVPPPIPFRIETVPRVGYRLNPEPPAPAALPLLTEDEAKIRSETALHATAVPRVGSSATSRRLRGALWLLPIAVAAALLAWQGLASRDERAMDWTIAGSASLDDLPPGARDIAVSPDGRRLAYRGQDAAGGERVFVRALDRGGQGVPISPAVFNGRRPAWSPDSQRVAFIGYDDDRPCRIYVVRPPGSVRQVGVCETVRDPRLSWSGDGKALLFGDASGENAVQRITALDVFGGRRVVLSNPPGDSMGDCLPFARKNDIVFQRQFGWADEGWIARDIATGRERVLWRRAGIANSAAATLPGGALAVAWTGAGVSHLDFIGPAGDASVQAIALGPVTAIASAGARLLIETDRTESALVATTASAGARSLAKVRGRVAGPAMLADGRLRFPVTSAGLSRIWERGVDGMVRPWGDFVATRISGVAPSPDGRRTAALVTGRAGREIVVLDAGGRPVYRWHPSARSVNPAAWSTDGSGLIAPVLDGGGWRLFALDPTGRAAPRDLGLPGYAVVLGNGAALYAVRAGETTGIRELWRIDGRARRLPIDLTLFDIVNWRPVDAGVWLPDRRDRNHPRLVLRDGGSGRVLRTVNAPGLAGPGSGLSADANGPIYVQLPLDTPEYALLTLAQTHQR